VYDPPWAPLANFVCVTVECIRVDEAVLCVALQITPSMESPHAQVSHSIRCSGIRGRYNNVHSTPTPTSSLVCACIPFSLSANLFDELWDCRIRYFTSGLGARQNLEDKCACLSRAFCSLPTDIRRDLLQFDGYVTSDSGAIGDIYKTHRYVATAAEAAAVSIEAGTDVNSGDVYSMWLQSALTNHLINESSVDAAVAHGMRIRMRLGLFDTPDDQPTYGPELVGSPEHHRLSYEASLQGLTLLLNKPTSPGAPPVLPLRRGQKIAVIGGNAETKTLMAGGTGGGLLSAEVVCKNATSRTDWCCIQVCAACEPSCYLYFLQHACRK
jgi:hypothetical protein